jgi:hypothetical protein
MYGAARRSRSAQKRAQEAERNVAEMVLRLDLGTEARSVAAEVRARAAEEENELLRFRLEFVKNGVRKWMPEEDWHIYE